MNTKPSRIRTTVCSLAVATVLGTATAPAAVAALNTAQIIASAVSQNCISWRVSGICYWLFCTPFGCKVRTSVKVTHFIPQTVVSTYVAPGGNPWQEMAFVSQTAGGLESAVTSGLSGVSAGGANPADMKNPGQRKSAVRFKYADAIGHPATSLIGGSIPGYSCDTAATPLMPYFLSTLDSAAWRTGVPESLYPEALVPGQREIGSQATANMWGNVYPRSGFISQTDDDKASAVVAQRVADIITRAGQPHVYQVLKGNRHDGYWPPGEVKENTGTRNHKWQRLAPHMTQSCAVFPDGSYTAASDNNEAFALWQPYSCCKKRGQKFLGSTDI
ncbi:TIGR03756 family integrating conjugative element protein [Yersinia alsatica]|uniref:TIGR03756 family integrating conjugative element protein n=1 Tax=Yersiniaceae TaxID=1903411 RepID=UPI0005E99F2D|nr:MULTISPECIES: TIGR03756 family integrating conjugative element protein [Yersiniaceae]MCI1897039.1 TIGR03756 family integrating conjugative element protein [Enterobacter sp.]MDF8320996.1 TIGR03756 family integrating conjugative element protein [Serratia nevei]EKN3970895.1 TIGR03756 family integrating conjugative element protein [Yersinia enterocolitica]EKN4088386.1 TIGR03756 family integrating conjugative element protein [Yersinia enterocolitica]ELI8162342.1 TIGR03756 family integrating conj